MSFSAFSAFSAVNAFIYFRYFPTSGSSLSTAFGSIALRSVQIARAEGVAARAIVADGLRQARQCGLEEFDGVGGPGREVREDHREDLVGRDARLRRRQQS